MNKLTDWIKRHQVAAYFIITFAITWGLGFSYGAILKRNQFLLLPLMFTRPAARHLQGSLSSQLSTPSRGKGRGNPFWITFFIAGVRVCARLSCQPHIPRTCSIIPALIGLFIVSVVPVALVITLAIPASRH